MFSHNAHNFICLFLVDVRLQQQLATSIAAEGSLTFSQWQQLASSQGYRFNEAEFEAALNADPALVPALEAVAADWGVALEPELEFELSEDELATIAGGGGGQASGPFTTSASDVGMGPWSSKLA